MEIHLCEACAEQKGTDFKAHFDFSKLLTSLGDFGGTGIRSEEQEALTCKTCGMTTEEFGKTGRLGCPNCYTSFRDFLMPLLKRVQRDTQHVGKVPPQASTAVKRTINLRDLHERLKKSIESEDFEAAATLRDQISQLEEKKKSNGKKKSG